MVAWGGRRDNKSVFTYTNIKIDLKYLHVTCNYVSLNITTHHFPSRLMTTRHYPSLHITLHYTPSLHITVHHYPSLHITFHHYPSLHITVHHYTSLSITTHHYPSLHITIHHYTSLSITTPLSITTSPDYLTARFSRRSCSRFSPNAQPGPRLT